MHIRKISHKFLILSLFLFPWLGCVSNQTTIDFQPGYYKRNYEFHKGDIYEVVELRNDGVYFQKFYENGQLRFSNTGKWLYIKENKNHTQKWSNGQEVVLFSDWISGDDLLDRERMGASTDINVLPKQEVSAVIYKMNAFSFDYDGGSDYIKQTN